MFFKGPFIPIIVFDQKIAVFSLKKAFRNKATIPLRGCILSVMVKIWQKWVFCYSERKVLEISYKDEKSSKKPKMPQKSLFGTPGVAH